MDELSSPKKVSIIIPTYNRAKFIPNAVNSIIKQKYSNIEIIIVDDGSCDNTESVVRSLKESYSNIFYYENERTKGPSGARNTGLLKSTGDYLAFLDSDDIWKDNYLFDGLNILNKNPEIDVLFGNCSVVNYHTGKHQFNLFDQKTVLHSLKSSSLSPNIKLLSDNIFIALLRSNFFNFSSSIIRKLAARGILMDESIMFSEDRDFAIKLYKQSNATFAFRTDPVSVSYIHDSNIYRNTNSDTWQVVLEAQAHLGIKYLKIFNLSRIEERILREDIAKKLSNLSYLYGKDAEYKKSLLSLSRSLRFCLIFPQLIDFMKVMIVFVVPKKFFRYIGIRI